MRARRRLSCANEEPSDGLRLEGLGEDHVGAQVRRHGRRAGSRHHRDALQARIARTQPTGDLAPIGHRGSQVVIAEEEPWRGDQDVHGREHRRGSHQHRSEPQLQ